MSSSRFARTSSTVGTFSIAIFCRCELLDALDEPVLPRLGQRDRDALAACTARAADAMHVGRGAAGTS
jgi:hypothetical protein